MKTFPVVRAPFTFVLCLLMAVPLAGCGGGDDEGDSGDGDAAGDGDAMGDGDSGDGDASGDGDGDAGDGDASSEAPADCAILDDVVGEYTVTGPATEESQRGESTADHMRGTVSVAADYSIDFDDSITFTAAEIMACYDRTNQDFDRRIQVSYGADDDGPVINIYVDESLSVEEIQYRNNNDAENIRVLVE